jgi:hypothetical protein
MLVGRRAHHEGSSEVVSPYQPGNNLVTLGIDCAEVLAGVILDILMKEDFRLPVSALWGPLRVLNVAAVLTGEAFFVPV